MIPSDSPSAPRPEVGRGFRFLSSGTRLASASEEELSLLQSRMALCWRVGALLTGAFLVGIVTVWVVAGRGSWAQFFWHSSAPAHLGGALLCLATWLLLRGPRRRFWTIAIADAVAGFLLLSFYCLISILVRPKPEARADLVLVFMTTTILAVRAIAVPASVRHTVVHSVVAVLPALAQASFLHWKQPLHGLYSSYGQAVSLSTLRCAMAVAIAGFASWVFHRLRVQADEARRLGQYLLERKIGEGGMGQVYLAQHALLRRPTAVKLLFPDRVGPDALARFEREVRLTATLTHPNTVSIFDYGRTPEGVFYYAMELLDGTDLESLVRRFGPQPPARVVHLLAQACGSLAEAHGRGLVHRDIKPANIILCERGGVPDTVKIVDFGLVKDIGVMGAGASEPTLTHANSILGTPLYMAPESLRGDARVDGRADLYALGAVGCFLLTGRPVFEATSVLEVCALHLNNPPRAPSLVLGSKLPEDLEALLLRCLAKQPGERPAGAVELRRALCACAVPAWTEEDARAWWAGHHGGEPPAPSAPTADALGTTAPAARAP
jgi:eukaryotic-like serine/threonine-protein kinase